MRILLTFLCFGLLSLGTQAQTLSMHDVEYEDHLAPTADSPELFLRGASLRRVYGIVDTYVGLLYVGNKDIPSEQIASADIPRRMEFRLVSNRVTSMRFVKVIEEGLALNSNKEELAAIEPRVQKLFQLFDYKFVKGTVGMIEWIPAQQVSRVTINGQIRGTVPGKDLSDALLRIWIGDHPVSERFKKEVLGIAQAE